MKSIITNFGSAALISFSLMLPFVILEFTFNTVKKQNFPELLALFGVLWLLAMSFIIILTPVVRSVRTGNSILANPIYLLFRVVLLTLLAMIWGGIIIDQLPCFLGVPNCD